MNAGVAGNEISKHLVSVRVLKETGQMITMQKSECAFEYRKSIFHDGNDLLLSAVFSLLESSEAKKNLNQYLSQRVKTQPIEMKNSGCVFKNPAHEFSAGQLIDKCGLKGLTHGGAEVSVKHANFINNHDNATFDDVFGLMHQVQQRVLEEVGVKLDFEVRII
jgi:UDP-N-acetylmuramate dehydrogenase